MILDSEKQRFTDILNRCKNRRKECFTQKEVAEYLKVSRQTIINLENRKNFDFWLLTSYANIVHFDINLNLINL